MTSAADSARYYASMTPEQRRESNRKKAQKRTESGKAAEHQRNRRLAGKDRAFSQADVLRFRELQRGLCAICSVELETLGGSGKPRSECADHDHVTSKPRGLLCSICNRSLGNYERHQRGRIVIDVYERYLAGSTT